MANAIMQLVATSSSRIGELQIKNGQLIFVQDLGRIALDFNDKRVFYNQIVELEREEDRQSLENPLGGYYFVYDSACLWFYKDGWTQITENPNEVLFIDVELPQLGQQGKLYVDSDDREISVWNETTGSYITVANYTEEVTESDIEGLFKQVDAT